MTDNKTSVSVNPAGALIASAIPSTETPLLLAGVNGNEDHFRTNLLTHVTPVLPGQLSLDQSSSNPTRATRASSLAQIGSSPATVAVTSNSIDPSLSGGKFPPKNMTSNSVPTLANLVTSSPQLNPHNGNHGGHQADTSMVDSESQPVLKKTSFQITSVTTIDSSASNDGGDESGDDLDESHTEDSSDVPSDVSSRHTSESRGGTVTNLPGNPAVDENFTRNDVFFNPSPVSAMGTAPVIPTSAQYGLAVVSLPHSENPNNSNPNGLTTVEDIPNFASSTETSGQVGTTTGERSEQERDHVHNRFKVVKIESTEPFRKGRWMCMDYVDHTNTTLTPTLTTAGTNRISVASTSQNPTQLTHGTTSHTSEVNSLPQQIQSNHSLSPPQIHQQQMIQTHLIGGDSVVQHQQQQQLIQQQMNVMHQQQPPAQIQMVPSTNEIPHGGDTHGLLNGTPSYQHLTHMNLNPHVINISGIDYSNPQQQTQSSQNVNTNQNLFQSTQPQATQQQQQQKQCYGNQSNLIQGPMDAQQGQPFQQQPMDSQQTHPHSVSIPVQQLSQQYSHAPPANQQNQQPLMQQQQQHPGQSLPHGAVSVVTVNQLNTVNPAQQQQQQMATSVANPTSTAQQQQVTQSLGHAHNIQIQKQAFISTGTAQQQPTNPTHFQNQQELSIGQSVPQMGVPAQQQTNYGQQQTQQQPQPQQQQGNMMMSGLPPIHQQQQHHIQHVQPMQVQVPQQSQQPVSQNPAMYTQQPQMQLQSMQMQSQQQQQPGGLPMAGQGQIINQTQHIPQLSQQQFATQQMHPLIQNQQQQQPSPQQMMSIAGQQSMVSQPQQQGMMNPQMMNQGMQPQGGQMSGMMSQGHQPQQIIGQTPSGVIQQAQQPLLQTLQQSNYQPQQQQNINTQQMPQQQQPIVHQTFQGQAQTMVPHQQMMSTPQQPTMIQQPQMNQQQQGMGSNLQQPQQTHSVHQLQGQNQMGMVVGGGQQPQYQPQPTQVQQQQPTNLVTNIQQSAVHPTSSTNQMGLPLNSGSSIPMINNAMGAATVSTAEMLSLGLQQQQPLSTASSLPPLGVNVSDSQLIQQQVTSLPVPPLLPGVDTTSGPPGGDTSSAPSTFTSQARMLLEESVVASDEGDSTSGTSTVAIDNKIEQAMDLVKSHLMFAVREEVEVLKERIAELMERINHLEYENTILRTNASAETLAQLQQSTTSAKSINPSNPNTNS